MSQYWAGGDVCHCHRVNSSPGISGGQEIHRAAGDQRGAVSLCPQGPDMRQWVLLSLYCFSLPSQGLLLGLHWISTPSPLSSGCHSRLTRLTSPAACMAMLLLSPACMGLCIRPSVLLLAQDGTLLTWSEAAAQIIQARIALQNFLRFPQLLCAGVEKGPSMHQHRTPAPRSPGDMHQHEDRRNESTSAQ